MENLPQKIIALEKEVSLCWECFITSRIEEGMKHIFIFFDDIGKIINEIESSGLKSFDINQIQNTFQKLEMAMGFPDYIEVADILNYEIKPTLEAWESELRVLT